MEPIDREPKPQWPLPSEDQIRERAYEVFLARAGRPGSPENDWIQAQQELLAAMNSAQQPAKVRAETPGKSGGVMPTSIRPQKTSVTGAPFDGVQMPPDVRSAQPAKQRQVEQTAPAPRKATRGKSR